MSKVLKASIVASSANSPSREASAQTFAPPFAGADDSP